MGIRSVTKSNPCPICGKADWCGIFDASDGGELHVCQRCVDTYAVGKEGVIGTDGNFYIYTGVSKAGAAIFEDAQQKLAKQRLKESGKAGNYNVAEIKKKVLTPVDIHKALDDAKLDKIYRRLLSLLILEPCHREYLLKEGWTDELIEKNCVRSFPEEDHKRFGEKKKSKNPWRYEVGEILSTEFGDLTGVPGLYKNQKGKWSLWGQSGIFFPLPNERHQIRRLRVRLDNVKSGGKYRNFSSFRRDDEAEKQGFFMNRLSCGCQADNHLGFYMDESRDDMYICYITEGEKKGIIGEWVLKAPFVSVPGVNSYAKLVAGERGSRPIDRLSQKGIKIFIIAYDADKSVNARVLESEQRTIRILKEEGFTIGLASWDTVYGKGIDDLLMSGHRPQYMLV